MSRTARAGVIAGVPTSSVSGAPATSSMTMYGRSPCVPKSRIETQLRCCRRLSARASRAKRLHVLVASRILLVQELERDLAPELDALGEVDHADGAAADLSQHMPSLVDGGADERIGRAVHGRP